MVVKDYRVGIELLDEQSRPIEHIDYWDEEDLGTAMERYESIKLDEQQSKYLMCRLINGDSIILQSEDYKPKKFVYLVTKEICVDSEIQHKERRLVNTLEQAKQVFKEFKEGLAVKHSEIQTDDDYCFEVFEEGCFNEEHITIDIDQLELEE